ncbi:MAG: TM0996/MTH895 family glutaredoxin-like protein [Bacteriovoracaceae bacterium]|nr:TM0996/MTH895 family glutaredoxin-like protein [Bacteriovoracaceae bacterium]
MIIKILGSGCKNCTKLEAHVREALQDLGKTAEIEKITDFAEIAQFNVMKTPALVVDEKLVSFGKVNEVSEIKTFLE